MGVVFDCWWIDPADVTIRAAVNQIDAAMSSSFKASLTEKHFKPVVASATMTGFHAVASCSSCARR